MFRLFFTVDHAHQQSLDIASIVAEAEKSFVSGDVWYHSAKPDNGFKMDADRIPGTNLIAARAPNKNNLNEFLSDIWHQDVKQVVSLCSNSTPRDRVCFYSGECFDYGYTSGSYATDDFIVAVKSSDSATNSGITVSEMSKVNFVKRIVESTLTIFNKETKEQRDVAFVGLPITDGNFVDVFDYKADAYECDDKEEEIEITPEETAKIVSDLFFSSASKLTWIHCAAGIGRTGHLILLLELMRNCHHVFQADVKSSVENIHGVLGRMRSVRNQLVACEEQFNRAIFSAALMMYPVLERSLRDELIKFETKKYKKDVMSSEPRIIYGF